MKKMDGGTLDDNSLESTIEYKIYNGVIMLIDLMEKEMTLATVRKMGLIPMVKQINNDLQKVTQSGNIIE